MTKKKKLTEEEKKIIALSRAPSNENRMRRYLSDWMAVAELKEKIKKNKAEEEEG